MIAALKKKWLRALRSGKYRQAYCGLKHGKNRFCCLGVLAEIQGAKWNRNRDPVFGEEVSQGCGLLEPRFAGGLRTKTQRTLASMNDDGKSFKEIADYIEKRIT